MLLKKIFGKEFWKSRLTGFSNDFSYNPSTTFLNTTATTLDLYETPSHAAAAAAAAAAASVLIVKCSGLFVCAFLPSFLFLLLTATINPFLPLNQKSATTSVWSKIFWQISWNNYFAM